MDQRRQPPPIAVPQGQPGDGLGIVYGHSAEIRRVLIQFSASISALQFDPDDAREFARQVLVRADLAEGKPIKGRIVAGP